MKLDAAGDLLHAAVFGGDRLDNAWVLGLDGAGRPYVGSSSCGDGFPTTPGAYKASRSPAADASDPNNECDVTVARFAESAGGFTLGLRHLPRRERRGFRRGAGGDLGGAAWVVGGTTSGDFPTTARCPPARRTGAASTPSSLGSLRAGARWAVLDVPRRLGLRLPVRRRARRVRAVPTSSAARSRRISRRPPARSSGSRPEGRTGGWRSSTGTGSLAWSTRLGGSGFDWPFAVAVARRAVVVRRRADESPRLPDRLPVQAGPGGDEDAFVSGLSPSGSRLTVVHLPGRSRAATRVTAWRGTGKGASGSPAPRPADRAASRRRAA